MKVNINGNCQCVHWCPVCNLNLKIGMKNNLAEDFPCSELNTGNFSLTHNLKKEEDLNYYLF